MQRGRIGHLTKEDWASNEEGLGMQRGRIGHLTKEDWASNEEGSGRVRECMQYGFGFNQEWIEEMNSASPSN